jgi:hypothetical protein
VSAQDYPRMDRRQALKWMLTAAAGMMLSERTARGGAATPSGHGYGTDPDFSREYRLGDYWPLTLSEAQRRTAAALCAMIIPADDHSPSAASLGVHDFIDEWISAPYPNQKKDRQPILEGLAWMDAEAQRRFGRDFAELDEKQSGAIGADLCHLPDAKPEFVPAATFFARYRDLTAGGFYTTPAGMKDLKYMGNVPLAEFKGPPPEVLKILGLS